MCRKTSAEGRVQSRYGENPMFCCDAVGPHKRRTPLLSFVRQRRRRGCPQGSPSRPPRGHDKKPETALRFYYKSEVREGRALQMAIG